MSCSFFTELTRLRLKSAAKRGAVCLLAAMPAFTAMAQQTAPLRSLPFPSSRSVVWDGEIMDNVVLRYRWVMRYPESINRAFAILNEHLGCAIAPSLANAGRQQIEEREEVVYLSGPNKRTEKRWVQATSSGTCAGSASLVPHHSIDIRAMERKILYTSRGDERKVNVTEPPSEVVAGMRSRAQARLRDARNPRTGIGRSMGRVWTERATFNGFDCGSTVLGVEHACVLLEQPRHVATNTMIAVRSKAFADIPACEDPAGPEWNNPGLHFRCAMIGHSELVSFEKNARIPRDLFEMPPEARGLPVNRTAIPEADEDRERD